MKQNIINTKVYIGKYFFLLLKRKWIETCKRKSNSDSSIISFSY
ncbi:hypothetical protein LEP1GSC082_1829 [Leptospira kirschneri str. H2]|nr:hypothetical protein LEP1GSC082_1829 [Leptospira kirschneri str. H2]